MQGRRLLGWLWKRLGSGLDGNELLRSLLWRLEVTYWSSWSLTKKWEADWKKSRKKIKWSVVVNFELDSFISSDAGEPKTLVWLAFSVKKIDPGVASGLPSRRLSMRCWGTWTWGVPSAWAGQLIAQDTSTPHQSVLSLSFLPLAQKAFLYVKRNSSGE